MDLYAPYYVVVFTVDADVANASSQKAWTNVFDTREEACKAMDKYDMNGYPVTTRLIEVK